MKVPKSVYNDARLVTWATPKIEGLIAILAEATGQWKPDYDPARICIVTNLLLVSGGKSGNLRNPDCLDLTIRELRDFMTGQRCPEGLQSFNPSPWERRTLEGQG